MCPQCGNGRVRPTDIRDEQRLIFRCSFPQCSWVGYACLPGIRKTVIYLDTSTVSHIARVLRSGQLTSPWLRLYKCLRQAIADEVICCPTSTLVQAEAELYQFPGEIVQLSEEFADQGLMQELKVREAQLARALDRFLNNDMPRLETDLPMKDPFSQDVHAWLPPIRVGVDIRYPRFLVDSIRRQKEQSLEAMKRIYKEYAEAGDSFETIRKAEARGYGLGFILIGQRSLRRRCGLEPIPPEDPIGHLWTSDLDSVAQRIAQHEGLNSSRSLERAVEFLESDHVVLTPVADIQSRLHAALAMSYRGPKPRRLKHSDAFDIDHISTFMPYMDIFITDGFFASLCNQANMRLGARYGTEVRSLGEGEVDDFIAKIESLSYAAPQARVARAIAAAMNEGCSIRGSRRLKLQYLTTIYV
jgi:hypothetical protein